MEDVTSGAEPAPSPVPRLAPASSSRQRDPPRGTASIPRKEECRPLWGPRDTHPVPTPPAPRAPWSHPRLSWGGSPRGVRPKKEQGSSLSRFTPHRGAGSSPQPWEVQLAFSPSGLGLREVGAGARTPQKLPGHPRPHTHINAVLAWLPRWSSGAGGASRSHFLKWRNVIRQLHPHPLPLAGGVPPGWRRARACPGPWQCPLPPRLGGRGCVGAEPRKQQRPHCISLVETQRWHRTLPGEEGQAPRASPRCPGVHGG